MYTFVQAMWIIYIEYILSSEMARYSFFGRVSDVLIQCCIADVPSNLSPSNKTHW